MATVGGDSSGSPTPQSSMQLFKPTGNNIDPGWEWNSLKDLNNKKHVTCDYCGKTTTGGITRAKKHQMGARGNVGKCLKTPKEVRLKLIELAAKKVTDKVLYRNEDEEDEEIQEIRSLKQGKRVPSSSSHGSTSMPLKKSKNLKRPIDLLLMKDPEVSKRLEKNTKQSNIKDYCTKEARAKTVQYIERFLIRNGIAFNVVRTKSFKVMIQAIGEYGRNLRPPTYHECRVSLLKKELEHTNDLMKKHVVWRENTGCSIMSDGWTDRKGRTLINFLVNTPIGSMFIKSIDASSFMKTGDKVFELLDNFVEEIGEDKVVQVITDNKSNYVSAGKMLMDKRKHLFWTPCVAHCLDLMLEDIGKLPKIKKACLRGTKLVGYIYNHSFALNLLRKFTGGTELVRHGVTRFATTFLTLQRLQSQKNNLRKMFVSDDWSKSKGARDPKGKGATNTVLMASFWADVVFSLKAMGPIVQVLRLVNNEKKPAMGYIYEAMNRAKENIQTAFKGDERKYRDIFAIFDRRWDSQMHHPLHAAGYYLNPAFFFTDPIGIENDLKVKIGLLETIARISPTIEFEDKAFEELVPYRNAEGIFGGAGAIRQRTTMAPAEWWKQYGTFTPHLMKIAVKVLSLTCSSSGCERNWSTFEHIHFKKRSRLEHQRLCDLVFIKYNQTLNERFNAMTIKDPILLKEVDDTATNEWLLGELGGDEDGEEEEFVFGEEDGLTWQQVSHTTSVGQPLYYTRRKHKQTATSRPSSSNRKKGKGKYVLQEEEEEEELDGEEETSEEEEIYRSDQDESSSGGEEELQLGDEDDEYDL